MNNQPIQNSSPNIMDNIELTEFKEKTDQLMSHLEKNDMDNAMKCISDINDISGKSFYSIIGKLTRGLHNAISDLSISSSQNQSINNKTRVDLNYVITVTDEAAQKTLDMTEKSMLNVNNLRQNNSEQAALIQDYIINHSPDEETSKLIAELSTLNERSLENTDQVGQNVSEIIMAQNFQDIASQSITKAIGIINDVESSLISLTQYANLLTKLSQYSDEDSESFELDDTMNLKSDITQMNSTAESEHLDQTDVDNLLSSLGF